MELDQSQPSVDTIDEATRLAASNRQLILNPVHETIVVEDEPDDLVANRHIIGAPIGNIATDSEATISQGVLKQERANHHIALATSIVVMIIVGAAAALSFFSR